MAVDGGGSVEPTWRVRKEDATFFDGVRVVTMPCCGFSFAADHLDLNGKTYTCPQCEDQLVLETPTEGKR